jgi:succinate dehydrogenase / fumarate reductase cytochrome b subunit
MINFSAVWGPETYNRVAARMDALPLVRWIEIVGIGVPIAAHVILGSLLGNVEQAFATPDGYPRAWMRQAQRWTGGILVVYVLYHVWSTRLSPEVLKHKTDLFSLMRDHLGEPAVFITYAIGVLAACAHLGVGLYEVGYRWGVRAPSRRTRLGVGWAVFALLSLIGLNAMLAFVSRPARWLEREPATVLRVEGR